MLEYTYIYFGVLVTVLYWNTILLSTVHTKQYYVNYFRTTCFLLQQERFPQFAVLRRREDNEFTHTINEVMLPRCMDNHSNGYWDMVHRPIVGDHIHLQMVLSVDDVVTNYHDRAMSQKIPYEVDNYPVTCPNPMNFSYEKRWYHTGVHTHCDNNIIHVHPWSAPNQLRVEGRDVKLKLWFESVGIEVATNKTALKLPDEHFYRTDWHMEYYIHVNDQLPSYVTTNVESMSNLWLVDHHGEILLWSGGHRPKKEYRVLDYKCHPKDYPARSRY